jgi:uncharacterized RDD family membrane protein YckC
LEPGEWGGVFVAAVEEQVMPEYLQFPLSSALFVLPILLGGILAMWSQVFVRNLQETARSAMFLGILVPTAVVGMMAASTGVWHAPKYDEYDLPYDSRRNFQTSLFLAFATSLVAIPVAAKMTPALRVATDRLKQRQFSLALLVALVGLAGPLVFFLYTLLHGPVVLLYVGMQYAVFGFILWQFTRPAPLEEEVPQHD